MHVLEYCNSGTYSGAPLQADGSEVWGSTAASAQRAAALCSVLRELTKHQGCKLAQLVVEMSARDRAAEGVEGG